MTEIEVVQWLFDTEVFTKALNWPVNADGMVFAKRQLDEAVSSKAAADDVLEAYKKFAGAIGPTVMTSLLQSDDAFPEVNHSGQLTRPHPGRSRCTWTRPASGCWPSASMSGGRPRCSLFHRR